ncbi:SIS domain-containing protein [Pseudoxanthobacter sp. M-2]|uniref:D-sedoheptulose-7-phosphate isomerase n=1 Tax=Pseudoxanthobacter sp. M-2 TaxID=3078754 RepID=UPI0038FBECA4
MATQTPLEQLYPFLAGGRQAAAPVDEALAESVRQKAAHHVAVFEAFFAEHGTELVGAARTIAATYRGDGRLFTMGNGGSSCDAAHVAVEFLHPITAGRPALTAVNLTTDVAMMTAVGNDVGYDHVFVRQVIAQGRPGDCLVGLSTSGNSMNLVLAFEKARALGLRTIGLTGGDGGRMAKLGLDHCLVVRTDAIHRIQECHVAIYHILWDLVHTLLADDRGSAARADDRGFATQPSRGEARP